MIFSYFLSAGCEAVPRHSRNNRSYSHFLESDGENYESRYRKRERKIKGNRFSAEVGKGGKINQGLGEKDARHFDLCRIFLAFTTTEDGGI